MPAASARAYKQRIVADEPATRRGQMRVVSDRSAVLNREAKLHAQTVAWRRNFFLTIAVFVSVGFIALGAVFINSAATTCSQHTALIMQNISQETARAQALELQFATLRSSERIEKLATTDMGMVAAGNEVSAIEIGTESTPQTTAPAQHDQTNPVLTRLAQLTTGEASALLVGDINLALSR